MTSVWLTVDDGYVDQIQAVRFSHAVPIAVMDACQMNGAAVYTCCICLPTPPVVEAALRPELRKDAEHTPPPVTTRDSNLSPVQGDGLAWTVRDWVASEACSLLSVVARADKAAAQLNLKNQRTFMSKHVGIFSQSAVD